MLDMLWNVEVGVPGQRVVPGLAPVPHCKSSPPAMAGKAAAMLRFHISADRRRCAEAPALYEHSNPVKDMQQSQTSNDQSLI